MLGPTSWRDWGQVSEYLQLMTKNPRYLLYVQALLRVVPRIAGQEGFEGVEPGIVHLTLTLGLPMVKRKIHLDLERPGFYNIYLDKLATGSEAYTERSVVAESQVVDILRGYVTRLRLEGLKST
jgi:hypothetical protein